MNELQLLKDITNLARNDDEGAKSLVMEWLRIDLTDFGSRDMISCKIENYLQEKQNGRSETNCETKSGESSGVLNSVKE